MIDRKQERTDKFNRKKKFKTRSEAPPKKKNTQRHKDEMLRM